VKAYKVELLVIDFDHIGGEEICSVIEEARYPNRCIMPSVKRIEERDIGDWTDGHPLNRAETSVAEYARLFGASRPRC
jgi:hypothetical protein